jgi:hypothetical protein
MFQPAGALRAALDADEIQPTRPLMLGFLNFMRCSAILAEYRRRAEAPRRAEPPRAACAGAAADGMSSGDYLVRILRRCRVEKHRLAPGDLLTCDFLRVAEHLVRCGTARPANERTRLDVELYSALRRALPGCRANDAR